MKGMLVQQELLVERSDIKKKTGRSQKESRRELVPIQDRDRNRFRKVQLAIFNKGALKSISFRTGGTKEKKAGNLEQMKAAGSW